MSEGNEHVMLIHLFFKFDFPFHYLNNSVIKALCIVSSESLYYEYLSRNDKIIIVFNFKLMEDTEKISNGAK